MKNIFIDNLKNSKQYNKIVNNINKSLTPFSIYGLSSQNVAHISYALNNHLKRQVLIITYDELKAKKMTEDLKLFAQSNSKLFPARQTVFYEIDAYSHEISNQRLEVMNELSEKKTIIVVASIEGIMNKIIDKQAFDKYKLTIKYGEVIDLNDLINRLVMMGYERVEMIEGKGQFSVRGGIIDFYPIISENPYRVELFDDEVDSIRSFDIKTQRSISNIEETTISPVKEILIEESDRSEIIENIKRDMDVSLNNIDNKNEKIKERISDKFNHYIERINSGLDFKNIDTIVPYIPHELESIINYLSSDSLIIFDNPNKIEENARLKQEDFINKYTDLFENGEVLNKQQYILTSFEKVLESSKEKMCISAYLILKNYSRLKSKQIIKINTKEMQSFHNNLKILQDEINTLRYKGYKIIILSGTKDRGNRLANSLSEMGIDCVFTNQIDREIKSGQVVLLPGTINKGFEYPDIKFSIISDKEIFGTKKRRKKIKKRKDSKKIESFTDLKIGDYVVHESHGIGKYVGVEQLNVQSIKKDYLTVKYSGNDKLYVPIDQMDLIQKYVGKDTIIPRVSKLGSGDWAKTKSRVKKAIEDMAEDLLKLYAKRHALKGYGFSRDKPWQKQFEDLFPYEETDDQLRCTSEIKKDMEKNMPMDRLLCGDVGYGKTEVALRAAFKCIMDGKQVAFLVPTTILAQQHYNTIKERFKEFPIKVEMLSRFRTPIQQKKIINDLRTQNMDIIIGTHRLLSKDVKFYDLGLLIIDEEQRFGVKHKEAIKKLKSSVDVLTLTATPIPRTLHMSLIGVRDMSVIEEPPEERYPVQTYVVEYNEQLVRDAIIKELGRGGQVYFVFNRVKGIKRIAARLKKLIPEAEIAVGHGQMSERELEKVMIDFLNGEYNVLVCTTIIETGLDIPNVNTMIVYNSDRMGLSQLYQLRGRVGRSNRIAYTYFTYEKDKVLSEVAEKRLKAIKEFTEFGSGFKIAMRDLEIRGAGNLLGSEQHGHMAAIGYDLYVKYLEEAVKKIKGEEEEIEIETTIELNVDGYIPDRYIKNEELKVEMYKKISSVRNEDDYSDMVEEFIDRFGDIPDQVENLLRVAKVKYMCSKNKIVSITQKNNYIYIEYDSSAYIKPEFINYLSKKFSRRMDFDISKKLILKYKLNKASQSKVLSAVEKIIKSINSFQLQ